ncbi:F390 synthetase-related protein [Pragia fontium]|uniref:Adenylate-forming enzyme n=1 Tax=Pragia fontium DSM 5563 = ATCC 49100 TaxID=1122977 RepID=A0AAJ4WB26_9GAMM|nr:F390 synthetase-related protein [Pragia fontium]SFC92409.1 putative adenylate-forming enzyme [Pragia fontium DSM 5563 = ATCC 49100]
MRLVKILWSYYQTRKRHFANRQALENYQDRRLVHFARRVMSASPYFQHYVNQPRTEWPMMDKAVMMANFDQMNTAGLQLEQVLNCALQSENSRDFSPTVNGYSVGLSSGTSHRRGVFVVSPQEQTRWAGTLLAKLLPRGLFYGERVALFLRANNNLYSSIDSRWISFRFFDLFSPFDHHIRQLERYSPTIVVAPAQVLRALALAVVNKQTTLKPQCVISVAEVLEPIDKALLKEVFGDVREVYQATEGFLGVTCAHGTMHLNEEFIHFEPQWLDEQRFVPIITDFTRTTQPIVRYRLDDVLIKRNTPCPCGSHSMAIERIEGRCDDVLTLPGKENSSVISVFADVCSRVFAQTLPLTADYQLTLSQQTHLTLSVEGDDALVVQCQQRLIQTFEQLGVETSRLSWSLSSQLTSATFMQKRRRILHIRDAE